MGAVIRRFIMSPASENLRMLGFVASTQPTRAGDRT